MYVWLHMSECMYECTHIFFEWMNVWSFVCAHFIPRMAVWDSSLFLATSASPSFPLVPPLKPIQLLHVKFTSPKFRIKLPSTSHQTYPTYVEWISIQLIWRGAPGVAKKCGFHISPTSDISRCWDMLECVQNVIMWFFLCACGVRISLPQYQCRSRLDAGTLIESASMPHLAPNCTQIWSEDIARKAFIVSWNAAAFMALLWANSWKKTPFLTILMFLSIGKTTSCKVPLSQNLEWFTFCLPRYGVSLPAAAALFHGKVFC